jgi:hypothetical protein
MSRSRLRPTQKGHWEVLVSRCRSSHWRYNPTVRRVLSLLFAPLVIGATPAPSQLSDRDFQQVMLAAVVASSHANSVGSFTTTVCVEKELRPASTAAKEWRSDGPSGATPSKVAIGRQRSIGWFPPKFILVSSKVSRPIDCLVLGWGPRPPAGWPGPSHTPAVVLSFTQPVLVNGYAVIEEYKDCCAGFLRVFTKHKGRWKQVTSRLLWQS